MTLTFGSLFAGIGGFDLGLECAGMECRWQVEIDPFCQKVLAKHWPHVARYSDVRECGKHNLEPVDVICGGFPCQDVSLAGVRAGLDGKRSTLWSEFYRIICEVRPRWIVVENVPGLYSSDDGRFFGKILRELAQGGYNAEWDCIPAAAFGAHHRRDRIFIVAYAQGVGTSILDGRQAPTREGGQLSTKRRRLPSRRSRYYWAVEPDVGRVANGVPNRVDRLRALGNAVVPQVAEWLGQRIMEVEHDR